MVEILIRPIVTEKMNTQAEKLNRHGFMVDKKADKHQIKEPWKKSMALSNFCQHDDICR